MTMIQWTIYDHPADYPLGWVVRPWLISNGTVLSSPEAYFCESLEEARARIPKGLERLPRFSDDDSVIVETWI